MAFLDYSSHWALDQFLTFLEANQLGTNDKFLYDNFAVEHNINTATIAGTHKSNGITGSSINKNPISTGSQVIGAGATWTPASGVYQCVIADVYVSLDLSITLQIYVSGAWRYSYYNGSPYFYNNMAYLIFCDGSNMRFMNNSTLAQSYTLYYQKF